MSQKLRYDLKYSVLVLAVAVSGCAGRSSALTIQPVDSDLRRYTTLALAVDSAVPEDLREERTALAVETIDRVRKGGRFQQARLARTGESEHGTLLMRATITRVKKVGDATRFFAGAFAGRANVTVEVKLIDAATGRIVGAHVVVGESGGTGLSGGTGDATVKAAEAMASLVG